MLSDLLLLLWIVIKIMAITIPLLLAVAYLTFIERKGIGYVQARIGPNRVGPLGFFQPIADVLKLISKESIIPSAANRYLFVLAPIITIAPALAAWAVIPFSETLVLTHINAGVLFLFTITSLGVYGILIAGWSTNSKYALLGSLRAAAQTVSYEIVMGFTFVGVLLAAGSMDLNDIVMKQQGGLWHWFGLPLLPLLVTYWISGIAETNRAPFDLAEGESEIVAGFHVEYSGIAFALFFLAEYMNMILIAAIASLLFLGGWLSPFQGIPILDHGLWWVPGIIWLFLKMGGFLWLFIWSRATFPRYRYDQLMRLGWKVLMPVTLGWIVIVALAVHCQVAPWFSS